jgi:hypothetical protein
MHGLRVMGVADMKLSDYLIDQTESDWPLLLTYWASVLPPEFTLWLVNRFGDLFVVLDDGTVQMLDVGLASISRVADSKEEFASLLGVGDNAIRWLLMPLVDSCVANGLTLKSNQCYGFKVPPVLGGNHGLQNIELTDLAVHYSSLAEIHRQFRQRH